MTDDLKYLRLLSRRFPTRQAAYTEIINLEAILNLPCATEHYMSDIHGELEAFTHILNNCSGVIREWVAYLCKDEQSNMNLDERGQAELCTLIYYPDEKLALLHRAGLVSTDWYDKTLKNLVNLARVLADGYTRSRVRKLLPEDYGFIIDELLHVSLGGWSAHHEYHERIVDSIIATGAAEDFIRSITRLIKRLATTKLHIVGDLYDRGTRADRVVDELIARGDVDIQWGNHDAAWMGAAAGSEVCIAQVVRTCVHYNSLEVLESSYGISLRELALFADATYQHEPGLHRLEKAINVIMFKLVEQAIRRHPNWEMQDRCLLGNIDVDAGTVRIGNKDYEMTTRDFPTLDPKHPDALSEEERRIMDGLVAAFADSDRLRAHVQFLYDHGSVYLINNGGLLFHGCVPLEPDGSFSEVTIGGERLSGRAYLDAVDRMARQAWATGDIHALDWMWYLWCGYHSPLSGRTMKTFERAYVKDKSTWAEPSDPYFELARNEDVAVRVLAEFGLTDPYTCIINGHTPVKEVSGDTPLRANGRLMVIDGGFCRAYHAKTGIAGYTLIADTYGLRLKAHRPFTSVADALASNYDIASAHETIIMDCRDNPVRVTDTDDGDKIREQIEDLSSLLHAYRCGTLPEHSA